MFREVESYYEKMASRNGPYPKSYIGFIGHSRCINLIFSKQLWVVSTPDQNCTERRRESAPFGWIWPE
jgi:hypothetical protein